jgi:hypothetical protein
MFTNTYLLTPWSRFLIEKLTGSQRVKGSLPHSQLLATWPYRKPDRTSPCPHILLPVDPSWLTQTPNIPSTEFNVSFPLLRSYQSFSPDQRPFWMIHDRICFYGEELLVPRPTPKLEDHTLSTVRDCWFNIFTATLHIGGCSSIRNPRTRHVHFSWRNFPYSVPMTNPWQFSSLEVL